MSLKKIELQHNIDLKKYTTIGIGGRAKYFFTAFSFEDLSQITADLQPPYYILGKGSNLLIKDNLIQTPIIRLAGNFSYIDYRDNFLEVGASTSLSLLLGYCLKKNLAGLENLVGIPATIGGLLALNAASFGRDIASCVYEVQVMDKKGRSKILKRDEITFKYRFSSLSDYIILSARFVVRQRQYLKERIKSLLQQRLHSQDFNFPSCGCIFKNPHDYSAAFLIDSCGLKGIRRGDAAVSTKHANFIINLGQATYNDVDYLIGKIKDRVYKKYSIILEEEIIRWV